MNHSNTRVFAGSEHTLSMGLLGTIQTQHDVSFRKETWSLHFSKCSFKWDQFKTKQYVVLQRIQWKVMHKAHGWTAVTSDHLLKHRSNDQHHIFTLHFFSVTFFFFFTLTPTVLHKGKSAGLWIIIRFHNKYCIMATDSSPFHITMATMFADIQINKLGCIYNKTKYCMQQDDSLFFVQNYEFRLILVLSVTVHECERFHGAF